MHGEQLAGDQLQVGEGAVGKHHQNLVGSQPAAGRAAPAQTDAEGCEVAGGGAVRSPGQQGDPLLGMEVLAGSGGAHGVVAVQDDARRSEEEVV